jgi:hypothetical protein
LADGDLLVVELVVMALFVRADCGVRVGEAVLDVLLCLSEVEHIVLKWSGCAKVKCEAALEFECDIISYQASLTAPCHCQRAGRKDWSPQCWRT